MLKWWVVDDVTDCNETRWIAVHGDAFLDTQQYYCMNGSCMMPLSVFTNGECEWFDTVLRVGYEQLDIMQSMQ